VILSRIDYCNSSRRSI